MSVKNWVQMATRLSIAMCLTFIAGVCPGRAAADLSATVQFNIAPQSLSGALLKYAEQSGVQVTSPAELVHGKATPGVIGTFPARAALDHLLEGTALGYRVIGSNTITIFSPTASTRSRLAGASGEDGGESTTEAQEGGQKKPFWDRFRVAQVDEGQTTGSGSVESQQKPNSGASLSEVVVTAQRRTERLLDVPISIVALGTDDLQNRKLTSLDDLQFAVPGMAVTSDGFASRIELRGVSNSVGVAPLVGVYLDEADVTNSGGVQINPNTYDLERVEVLRGPQGTLYGEGSAGGTVRFITKNPVLDRYGMSASVASLFTQHGSPGEHIDTAVNVPLIENVLGLRMVGAFHREGGWIDQPAAGLKDINGQDLTNVRVKSLWKPSEQFSASFTAELYRNDRSTGTNDDISANFTQVFGLTTVPKVSEDHDIYNLTLSYEFNNVKILSATSYLRERVEARNLGYTNSGLPGTPTYDFLSPLISSNDHAVIEELRLSSIGSSPWQWTVGSLYRHYRDVADQPAGYYGQTGLPLPPSFGASLTDTLFRSWSFFGDINYTFWQRFTLGLGVRSFHENQDYIQVSDDGSGPIQSGQTGKFHSVDPRVYAQYKLSRNINLYASAAKGFRSGGFNFDPAHPTFDPEDVRTYELGTKMSLLDGRLHAETAIFYTDYRDYVVNGLANLTDVYTADLNVGSARLKGVDWDLVWRLSSQWSLGINGDYIDTRFTKINATSTAYQVGDPLDFVPKYQVSSFAERDFAWNGKQVSMRLDYTRRGRMTYRYRPLETYSESNVINLLGYYMNLRWNESLSFNLSAQNLLNDRGLNVPNAGSFTRSRPRTYGAGFDVSF